MAKNMRVHELAKELGMTNGEAVDLAVTGRPREEPLVVAQRGLRRHDPSARRS